VHPAFREELMQDQKREIAEAIRFAYLQQPAAEPSAPRPRLRLKWVARRRVRHAAC
jgi:hypothetical protein